MAENETKQQKRKRYLLENPQTCFVTTAKEKVAMRQRAKLYGNTVGQQYRAESQAYIRKEYLPTLEDLKMVETFMRVQRGIANNINQMAYHSNRFRRVVNEKKIFELLEYQEREFCRLMRSAWRPTK